MYQANIMDPIRPGSSAGIIGRGRPVVWLLVLLTALLGGCAASPSARFEALSRALAAAREGDVARWAPETLAEAEGLLAAAGEEIAQQEGRRAVVRSFRIARIMLDKVEYKLSKARIKAKWVSRVARLEAAASLGAADAELSHVRAASQKIPHSADTAEDRAGIQADLAALEADLERARGRFAEGTYVQAAKVAGAVEARGQRMAETLARSLDHALWAEPAGRGRSTAERDTTERAPE